MLFLQALRSFILEHPGQASFTLTGKKTKGVFVWVNQPPQLLPPTAIPTAPLPAATGAAATYYYNESCYTTLSTTTNTVPTMTISALNDAYEINHMWTADMKSKPSLLTIHKYHYPNLYPCHQVRGRERFFFFSLC